MISSQMDMIPIIGNPKCGKPKNLLRKIDSGQKYTDHKIILQKRTHNIIEFYTPLS